MTQQFVVSLAPVSLTSWPDTFQGSGPSNVREERRPTALCLPLESLKGLLPLHNSTWIFLKALLPPVPPMGLQLLRGNLMVSRPFCRRVAELLWPVLMATLSTGAIAQKAPWPSECDRVQTSWAATNGVAWQLFRLAPTERKKEQLLTHVKCRHSVAGKYH